MQQITVCNAVTDPTVEILEVIDIASPTSDRVLCLLDVVSNFKRDADKLEGFRRGQQKCSQGSGTAYT